MRPIARRGRGDLISDYSLPLTARAIGWLLGAEGDRSAQLAAWAEEIMHSPLTVTNETERGVGYAGAFPEFTAHLEGLATERLAGGGTPGDTIHRILAAAREAVCTFLDHFAPGEIRLATGFVREWMPLPYMLGPVRVDVEATSQRAGAGRP